MSKNFVRVSTEAAEYVFEVDTKEAALAAFAKSAGYCDYAELASTLGKTVDEACAELSVEHLNASEVVTTLAERAAAAPSLMRLWDAVEDYVEACREHGYDVEGGVLDLDDLPSYGGEYPGMFPVPVRDDALFRSWDETHLLIERPSAERRFIIARRAA